MLIPGAVIPSVVIRRILQGLGIEPLVRPSRHRLPGSPLTAEQCIQVIVELRKAAGEGIQPGFGGHGTIQTGLPLPATDRIAENRIGLIDRLELLLGVRIIAVEIRMPAARQLAEGPFQAGAIGTRREPENSPVVHGRGRRCSGGHRAQSSAQGSSLVRAERRAGGASDA